MEFHIDIKGLSMLNAVFKKFPKEMRKPVSQCLNDQARTFKELAPKTLGTKYTIRDEGFVNRQFKVKKAMPGQNIEEQGANAYTEKYKRFSGWEEELYGSPRAMRSTGEGHYHRLIWDTAHGGNHEAKVKGQYRLRMGGEGYNSDKIPDMRDYGMPAGRFIAMLSKSLEKQRVIRTENSLSQFGYTKRGKTLKRKKIKIYSKEPKRLLGKNKIFILGGPQFPLGLYRFKNITKIDGRVYPEIEMMQHFKETPPRAEKFDWRQMTIDKVKAWFPPSVIFEKYIAPVLRELSSKNSS